MGEAWICNPLPWLRLLCSSLLNTLLGVHRESVENRDILSHFYASTPINIPEYQRTASIYLRNTANGERETDLKLNRTDTPT